LLLAFIVAGFFRGIVADFLLLLIMTLSSLLVIPSSFCYYCCDFFLRLECKKRQPCGQILWSLVVAASAVGIKTEARSPHLLLLLLLVVFLLRLLSSSFNLKTVVIFRELRFGQLVACVAAVLEASVAGGVE